MTMLLFFLFKKDVIFNINISAKLNSKLSFNSSGYEIAHMQSINT